MNRRLILMCCLLFNACSVKARAIDVTLYGATGNGLTNDTAAVQAAMNASADVYFPAGIYLVSGLSVQFNDAHIHGDGLSSVLLFASGASGAVLNGGSHNFSIQDIALSGGNDISHKYLVSDPSVWRSGIKLSASSNSAIRGVSIHGFDAVGIWTTDTAMTRQTTLSVSDSTIYNCWDAFLINKFSEYVHIANMDIHDNRYGLDVEAGNFSGVNAKLNDNGYGLYLYGRGNPNNGHGNLTGSQITHSGVYAIDAVSITVGFNLSANQIHDGDIMLSDCRGINISGGTLDVNHYYFDGGGTNVIRGNFIYGAFTNTIHHNWNGHTDATVVTDNFR